MTFQHTQNHARETFLSLVRHTTAAWHPSLVQNATIVGRILHSPHHIDGVSCGNAGNVMWQQYGGRCPPVVDTSTWRRQHQYWKSQQWWKRSLWEPSQQLTNVGGSLFEESMKEAGEEEKKLAIERGSYHEGIPAITIIVDAGWSKCSHKHSYNAKSGVGIIVGMETKKLLYVGVRNKYCSVCARGASVGIEHECHKNWHHHQWKRK